MEDARLLRDLRNKKTSLSDNVEKVGLPPRQLPTGKPIQGKPVPKVETIKQENKLPDPEVESLDTPRKESRGVYIGIENGKPILRLVGKISDLEYLGLVKYAEFKLGLTMDLVYNPMSNTKVLEELKNRPLNKAE